MPNCGITYFCPYPQEIIAFRTDVRYAHRPLQQARTHARTHTHSLHTPTTPHHPHPLILVCSRIRRPSELRPGPSFRLVRSSSASRAQRHRRLRSALTSRALCVHTAGLFRYCRRLSAISAAILLFVYSEADAYDELTLIRQSGWLLNRNLSLFIPSTAHLSKFKADVATEA